MANDLWRIPPSIYRGLDTEFSFCADMAASDSNFLCTPYFTEQEDSLSLDWNAIAKNQVFDGPRWVWCNPPYSNPLPWVEKAIETQQNGSGVVMLLNNDPSVGWYLLALQGASEIRHLIGNEKPTGGYTSGRIAFLNQFGDPVSGNNKPQVVFVFDPHRIGQQHTTYVKRDDLMTKGQSAIERRTA